jgi:N-acetylglucosaminyldiphosphoundecaprenol N-acetyl-beta-D-mannosaminyltransferase
MKTQKKILGVKVDGIDYDQVLQDVFQEKELRAGNYIAVANVHMIMEAYHDSSFQNIINNASLVTPDGMPLVWGLKFLGVKDVKRVYGPDLMLRICEEAEKLHLPVGFYGGSSNTLAKLHGELILKYPSLKIKYSYSPPFTTLNQLEDDKIVEEINAAQLKILFVGLGCPKQERWMYEHREKVNCTMIGVGAAFDFIAKTKPQAPIWMQQQGLEWLFRLITEPRRLWSRYLLNNPHFVILVTIQILKDYLVRKK